MQRPQEIDKMNFKRLYLICLVTCLSLSVESAVIYNQEQSYQGNPTLLNIFTRKTRYWPNGARIRVFAKPLNSIEHKYFVMSWLGVSTSKYRQLLEDSNSVDQGSKIQEVFSDEEMLLQVSITPNSIGYLDNKLLVKGYSDIKIITH